MSDPVRIALVAEGPTDAIVIEAALSAMLGERAFVLKQLQPVGSIAFGPLGGGWGGVYRWCKQSALRGGGNLGGDALVFANYDLLLLHVDADVADETYGNANLVPETGDGSLPCAQPCPPASATTDRLRSVVLSWSGMTACPAHTVICMPSKSTETWVIAALFPADAAYRSHKECLLDPAGRLAQQPKARRIGKTQKDYRARAGAMEAAWGDVLHLGEASRFQTELSAALA